MKPLKGHCNLCVIRLTSPFRKAEGDQVVPFSLTGILAEVIWTNTLSQCTDGETHRSCSVHRACLYERCVCEPDSGKSEPRPLFGFGILICLTAGENYNSGGKKYENVAGNTFKTPIFSLLSFIVRLTVCVCVLMFIFFVYFACVHMGLLLCCNSKSSLLMKRRVNRLSTYCRFVSISQGVFLRSPQLFTDFTP